MVVDRQKDRQTDRQTDKVSYRGALLLKIQTFIPGKFLLLIAEFQNNAFYTSFWRH